MKQLQFGQHFGSRKRTIRLDGTILTEAGYQPNIEVPWHYHENAYFFYHLRGRLDEVNKKKKTICTSGTLLYHHWQDPHRDTNFSEDAVFFHIELGQDWFAKHGLKASQIEGSILLKNPSLQPIFRKIYLESKITDEITQISVDGLLLQAFSEILRESQKGKTDLPEWVKKVREIISDEAFEKLSLNSIAQQIGLHPVYLSREFPKYFQTNLGEYMRRMRLEKAIWLLQNKTFLISEIAYQCGFADESHFIRCFRRRYGMTPAKYRKSFSES